MRKQVDDLSEVTELNDAEIAPIFHTLECSSLTLLLKWIIIKRAELALWLSGLLQRKNMPLLWWRQLSFAKWHKALSTVLLSRFGSREA